MKEFFKDKKGKLSSMRLMSFMSLIVACVLAIMNFTTGTGSPEIVLYFLVSATAPKVVQKFAEDR